MVTAPSPSLQFHAWTPKIGAICASPPPPQLWRSDMPVRPQDLAARMSAVQPPQIFKLPIEEARCKAREILNQLPQGDFTPVVENWRQLPNGQIEFTMRHLRTAD